MRALTLFGLASFALSFVAGCAASPGPEINETTPTAAGEASSSAAVSTKAAESTATAVPPSPTAIPEATARPRTFAQLLTKNRITLGYYVPYDATSWRTLEAQADRLDYLSAQWVSIDACGGITSRDDRTLIDFAQSRGIRVVPSLLTMDQSLNHRILTDQVVRSRAIDEIVAYVLSEGYDGFDLDLEDVNPADRTVYSSFVADLSQALHKKNKILMAAIPAKAAATNTGWSGAYDYAALAPHLDLVLIMSYDYSWASGPPGSIAPYDWVDRVMAYVSSKFPPHKVLMGLAFYGYDWNTTTGGKARALRHDQAVAVAEKFGATIGFDPTTRSGKFSYSAKTGEVPPPTEQLPAPDHNITIRKASSCGKPLPSPTPRPPITPTPTPRAVTHQHTVWVENAPSVAARLDIVDKHQLGGVGAWRLGQEDPNVWLEFEKWRRKP